MINVKKEAAEDDLFAFLNTNPRGVKPRKTGITEIRGPYYSVMGKRYLEDVLDTTGGSFILIQSSALREIIETAHAHDVLVSTGGFMEYVLTRQVIKLINKTNKKL